MLLMPLASAFIEGSCQNDQMHMGMVAEIPFMGVEYGMDTAAASHVGIAAAEAVDRLPGGLEEQVVCDPLMSPEQSPQLCRYREGHHEVINGQ
jgi:hypothetical protein